MAERVGIEQAAALTNAEIKVIANGGDIASGMNNITDVLNAKGGTALAGMFEALTQNKTVQNLLTREE